MIVWISVEINGVKLSHQEWVSYVTAIAEQVKLYADETNYMTHSIVTDLTQHCHWCVEFNDNENGQKKSEGLSAKLGEILTDFNQEHIRWYEVEQEYLIDG